MIITNQFLMEDDEDPKENKKEEKRSSDITLVIIRICQSNTLRAV